MALLNVRVEDHVLQQLKEQADESGVTLSEYVRDVLREVVVSIPGEDTGRHGDQPSVDSMRLMDRQVLALLHRILAQVLPEEGGGDNGDAADQLERARIIEQGFTGEYWVEVAGFRTELSRRDCSRVIDILNMFRMITYSIKTHADAGEAIREELGTRLEFRGFDHNDPLEGHMADYVDYFISDGKWSELKPQIEKHDNGNSHMEMLDIYGRMLSTYRRIMDSRERRYTRDEYLLSPEELEQIASARTHPSHRK